MTCEGACPLDQCPKPCVSREVNAEAIDGESLELTPTRRCGSSGFGWSRRIETMILEDF
ncbi:MAG TPA: hypothetical protein VIK01_00140 [Polyangiaceae bacterium]